LAFHELSESVVTTITITNLSKRFGSQLVLKNIKIDVGRGEFIALLGPSGCGKSTLLRLIAGLETPDSGSVKLGDRDITHLAPEKRDVALMFQSYALLPHMSVFENVRFPLRMKNVLSKADQALRVNSALQQVQLENYGERYPRQLSGGQQQRVALARAIVAEPQVLLLDEPLSNLDARLRENMQIELKQLYQRLQMTTIFVTHDQSEALALADRVVLMNEGIIEQVGTPQDLYERPKTVFAADFIGGANILWINVNFNGNKAVGKLSDGSIVSLPNLLERKEGLQPFMVRQEAIQFSPRDEDVISLKGVVESQHFSGSVIKSIIRFGDKQISAVTSVKETPDIYGNVIFGVHKSDLIPLEIGSIK